MWTKGSKLKRKQTEFCLSHWTFSDVSCSDAGKYAAKDSHFIFAENCWEWIVIQLTLYSHLFCMLAFRCFAVFFFSGEGDGEWDRFVSYWLTYRSKPFFPWIKKYMQLEATTIKAKTQSKQNEFNHKLLKHVDLSFSAPLIFPEADYSRCSQHSTCAARHRLHAQATFVENIEKNI